MHCTIIRMLLFVSVELCLFGRRKTLNNIIDEINRGNISKIFGELLMLIEADKRGPEYAMSLTYSEKGETFYIPKIFILLV